MEYPYPIDVEWSQEEIIQVIEFFNAIESYYESSIERDVVMNRYQVFKKVVPGKADEKNIFEEFKKTSGYDSYKVVQQAKNYPDQKTLSDN
ncbi:hypothetical protein BU649_03770 [Staphylococcus chromogenes]|uniref:UPF0223 family protein n=1 Tax=Staphylococcus chromogenes TaxID=46126 RepID=A0AAE5SY26_STACR|nr:MULTISPECIES: UPF0223 family protein [Staphylococcus]KDP13553.1 hypothetical protein SCHR_00240 [Staphylococcus chromogenes MU 970]MBP0045196.1 UPF0223 family protein [Staphylococcus chromogenes]MBV5138735.1 UPF0223 family protein [Staphylococcus chromogenes]MBV5191897.1 UPF0223 family protein [Staphylococcus chromogenes]MBW3132505.1 UPF0223 family protein [Staphylococcus chromogenes]